ncbi:MAG: DNA repair protein RecO [Clostridia bacterium]|nr:DNA repair protein RecO [Clostridia bacterium]
MVIQTNGIVLKQIKTGNDRRIIVLFSQKLGKVSVASTTTYHTKSKSSAILQPFNYGKYMLYQSKDIYNMNQGEVIKSFYKIGEDIDKYACSSYILEFTDKILAEHQPDNKIFNLLLDFLNVIESRKKDYLMIVRAYEIKALSYNGIMPQFLECIRCGDKNTKDFSIVEGSLLCESCRDNNTLILSLDHIIIEVMKYIEQHSIKELEKLSLDKMVLKKLNTFMQLYLKHHMEINNMKSVNFLNTCL